MNLMFSHNRSFKLQRREKGRMGRYSNSKRTEKQRPRKPKVVREQEEEDEEAALHAFVRLPPELVVHVLSFVPHQSANTVLHVCRLFRAILTSADCDFIWCDLDPNLTPIKLNRLMPTTVCRARWCRERWPSAVLPQSNTI